MKDWKQEQSLDYLKFIIIMITCFSIDVMNGWWLCVASCKYVVCFYMS